ncbi:MAG: response regulator [Chloroflexi bacterium]|nr:response regulator [Chloroflexota bacterium]
MATPQLLLVDDDISVVLLTRTMLEGQGFRILEANDGETALDVLKSNKIDLIVLDAMMPNMDGFSVARQIRENPNTADIPILMFTSMGLIDDKVAAFEAGVNDFIQKPVHPKELVARIKALLAKGDAASGDEA